MRCRYCGGSFPPKYSPVKPMYRIEELVDFIERFDKEPTIFFYGGEPLLNTEVIVEVMELMPDASFGIQTNAVLHRKLPDKYWARFDTVLLSIDGVKDVTDAWRGHGVYDKVLEALAHVRRVRERFGRPKTIIARMVATKDTVIERDALHLLELGFDKVHWQINAVWSEPWDIWSWGVKYLNGLKTLATWVVKDVVGRFKRIVPFHGIASSILVKKFEWYPCGAGRSAFAINTDGRVMACPIAVAENWATLGTIHDWDGKPLSTRCIPETCRRCDYFNYCGGRCLYAQMESMYWPTELLKKLDEITKRTIDIVREVICPELAKCLEDGSLTTEEIAYDPTKESTEVIP